MEGKQLQEGYDLEWMGEEVHKNNGVAVVLSLAYTCSIIRVQNVLCSCHVYVMEFFNCLFQAQKQNRIQRRGAAFAVTSITLYFGRSLPQKLPKLWEIMIDHLKNTVDLAAFGKWHPFLVRSSWNKVRSEKCCKQDLFLYIIYNEHCG